MSETGERARPTISSAMQSTDGLVRTAGREFLLHFYAALRTLKLYPVENEQVQHALDDLQKSAKSLLQIEEPLEVRISGEFIFVNATRLRLNLDNYASFGHVLITLAASGVGVMTVDEEVKRRDWQVFVSLLLQAASTPPAADKLTDLNQKMIQGGVTNVSVDPPID